MVQKIACVGSINLDYYQKFDVNSIFLGGSATNTAYYLAEMCDPLHFLVSIVGVIGRDANGQLIREKFKHTQILTDLVFESPGLSGDTQISLDEKNERQITRSVSVSSQLNHYLEDPAVQNRLKDYIIHFKGNYGVLEQIFHFKNSLLSADISGFLGSWSPEQFQSESRRILTQKKIQILFGNQEEFAQLAYLLGIIESEKSFSWQNPKIMIPVIHQIQAIYAANVICVKLGFEGAVIFSHNIQLQIPAISVKVVDSTGAGDAFNAGFLYKFLLNSPLYICGLFACALGSLKCTVIGPQSLKFPLSAIEKLELI